jgi:hypothetical protein
LSDYHFKLAAINHFDTQRVKEMFMYDRATLSVVAALLLTMSYSGLLLQRNSFLSASRDTANGFFVFAYLLSNVVMGLASLLCVWIGSYQYLKLNFCPHNQVLKFLTAIERNRLHPIMEPLLWMTIALYAVGCTSIFVVYNNFGSLGAGATTILVAIFYAMGQAAVTSTIVDFKRTTKIRATFVDFLSAHIEELGLPVDDGPHLHENVRTVMSPIHAELRSP